MRWRFQWLYRFGLALCVVGAFWALWASAQPAATNAPAATQTNQVGAIEKKLGELEKKLEERDLLFHLDQVAVLRTNTVFGQPLWKYIASLIYVFLAFYISKLLDFLTGVWLKK